MYYIYLLRCLLGRILTAAIPIRRLRRRLRRIISGRERTPSMRHKIYGKIYMPYYNHAAKLSNVSDKIYNAEGQRMETFFLRDIHSAHCVLSDSKYFVFDRFNFGLDTHFYSHNAMLEQMGSPSRKFGLLYETPSMVPDDYEIFKRNKGLEKDFDLIFAFDAEILEKIDNARFFPAAAGLTSWYPIDNMNAKRFELKSKNVSIISSHKQACALHILRNKIAKKCKREALCDTFGTFDGGTRVNMLDEVYDNYRYSIVVENDIRPYQFSERLTSCFAAMTVPIYIGATKISEFFNTNGMICVSSERALEDIPKIITQCSSKDYADRLPAIIENFEKSKEYISIWDTLYLKYLKK